MNGQFQLLLSEHAVQKYFTTAATIELKKDFKNTKFVTTFKSKLNDTIVLGQFSAKLGCFSLGAMKAKRTSLCLTKIPGSGGGASGRAMALCPSRPGSNPGTNLGFFQFHTAVNRFSVGDGFS